MDIIKPAWQIIVNPKYTKWTSRLQVLADAALCILIVLKVPYTEIDWIAYMQQIQQFIAGERDYAKIHGDTGPLVYPAAHVYIYRVLYSVTDSGRDIFTAQCIFIGLYLASLMMVMHTYRLAKVPPYIFPLLSMSKRVHSIFMLRLFNDGFAVFFLFAAIALYQRRQWMLGTLMYSIGLGVKMSLLLALPAVGVVLWQGVGRDRALKQAQNIVQVQTLLASPFLVGSFMNYVARAFELSRTFMFKWTVNWRFIGEDRFLSRPFSLLLLAIHLLLLHAFGIGRWFQPADWNLFEAVHKFFDPPPKKEEEKISRKVTPDFILTAVLSAIMIGCLCARSLHYQFFVYIAWSTPFLLWRSGMHAVLIYAICIAQEWAWNVYPSTNESSMVVVGCMAATVGSAWIGTSPYRQGSISTAKEETDEHAHAE